MNIQERSWSFNELKNDLNNLESSLTFKITCERTEIQDVNVFNIVCFIN
jgi:hypothetical protein